MLIGTDTSWPPPESEAADAEAILIQIPAQITQIEQTFNQAKVHLSDLKAAQELRADLAKAARHSQSPSGP